MEEKEIFIDTEEIAEFLFKHLTDYGYIVGEDELDAIADIMFDYLLSKTIIDEEETE